MGGVALAIPSTLITGLSLAQATAALHEISRAACIFHVSEITIYDVPVQDGSESKKTLLEEKHELSNEAKLCAQLLQYFVTPKHLRRALLGSQKPFLHARKMPRIPGIGKAPSHIIEGITVQKHKNRKKSRGNTPYVQVGAEYLFELKAEVPVNRRVTVDTRQQKVVNSTPRGYIVRAVSKFSYVFTEALDEPEQTFFVPSQMIYKNKASEQIPLINRVTHGDLTNGKTSLFVFGKWPEVSLAAAGDPEITVDASALFDGILTSVPSHTRTEDAILIALAKAFPESPAPSL